MGLNTQPKNFQYWAAISATPNAFTLDGGSFGLLLSATAWGTAQLQKLMPDGATWLTVATVGANGYQELHLPPGQYQLLLTGVTSLTGTIEKIASGAGAWNARQ